MFQNDLCRYTFIYTWQGNCFEFYTKAMGGKVFHHVVPAAALGRALLTSLPPDSQAPRSLTWVVADFHSIVPCLPCSAILFPVEEQEVLLCSCSQHCELQSFFAGTHTWMHTTERTHPLPSRFPSSLSSGCPSLMWRWPPGMMGWSRKHVCFPFQDTASPTPPPRPACMLDLRVQKYSWKDIATHSSNTINICAYSTITE